jgi:hypothetical protein
MYYSEIVRQCTALAWNTMAPLAINIWAPAGIADALVEL